MMPRVPTAEEQEACLRERFVQTFNAHPDDLESTFKTFSREAGVPLDAHADPIIAACEQLLAGIHGDLSRAAYRKTREKVDAARKATEQTIAAFEELKRATGADFPVDFPKPRDVWRDLEIEFWKKMPFEAHRLKPDMTPQLRAMLAAIDAIIGTWDQRYSISSHRPPSQALSDWLQALADIFVAAGGRIAPDAKRQAGSFYKMAQAINGQMRSPLAHSVGALDKRIQRFLKAYKPSETAPISDRRRRLEHYWFSTSFSRRP